MNERSRIIVCKSKERGQRITKRTIEANCSQAKEKITDLHSMQDVLTPLPQVLLSVHPAKLDDESLNGRVSISFMLHTTIRRGRQSFLLFIMLIFV